VQPGRQRRVALDEGLPYPDAQRVLRAIDADGRLGLREAPEELLLEAWQRTGGWPRALELLFAILATDRETSLPELLDDVARLRPGDEIEGLACEAFHRLNGEPRRSCRHWLFMPSRLRQPP
jgi:hypothetical protein